MSFADFCAVLSLEITKSKKPLQVIPPKKLLLSPKRKEGGIKQVMEKKFPRVSLVARGNY